MCSNQGDMSYQSNAVFTNPGIGTPFLTITDTPNTAGYTILISSSVFSIQYPDGHIVPWESMGLTGATGAQGHRGYQGPPGIPGLGVTGATGATGYGATGLTGATGPTGEAGTAGTAGDTGSTGDIGATGPTGEAGTAGTAGDTGPTGDPGATGSTGDTGMTGAQGPVVYFDFDGGSPSTIYAPSPVLDFGGVAEGTVNVQMQFRRGLSTDWANLLNNPLMAQGELGLETDTMLFKIGDGINNWNDLPYGGLYGPTGATGPTGTTGATGDTGTTGPTGLQGPSGDPGTPFLVSAQGPTGTGAVVPPYTRDHYDDEPIGFSFLDTTNGVLYIKNTGASGDWSAGIPFGRGPTGDTGPTGETGATGATGASSTEPGPTGATGAIVYYEFDGGAPNTSYVPPSPVFDFGGVAPGTVNVEMQLRRGIAADWLTYNPILADGELGLETDTKLFKIGDGTSDWNSLAYGGLNGPTGSTGPTGPSPYQSIPPNATSNTTVAYDNVNCQMILSNSLTYAQVSPVLGTGLTWAWSGSANLSGPASVPFSNPNSSVSAGTWYNVNSQSQQMSNSGDSTTVYLQDSNANKAYQIVYMANGSGGGAINIQRFA